MRTTLARAALTAMLLVGLSSPALSERDPTVEEAEALAVIALVVTEWHGIMYHIGRTQNSLMATGVHDLREMSPYMKSSTNFLLLMHEYASEDYIEADVKELVTIIHRATEDLLEVAFAFHKFSIKWGAEEDITEDLFQSAIGLEAMNRVLALHM